MNKVTIFFLVNVIPLALGVSLSYGLFLQYKSHYFTTSQILSDSPVLVSPFEAEHEQLYLKKIKKKSELAFGIVKNFYEKSSSRTSEIEMKEELKEILRPIRYGHDYYFIVSSKGIEELFPIAPHLEGKNLSNLKDAKGKFVIQEEIRVALSKQKGFVSGYWKKEQSDSKATLKISYIKYFKPLDWIIGYGEFVDELEKKIKEKARQQ